MNYYTKAEVQKANRPEADFIAVASTAVEDRHGEIVSVEGWDTKSFQKNPVLLWAHDHFEPAVGKATKVWIEGTGKRAKLMIEGVIHDYTDRARAVKQLVKDGIISTMSVGFRPIEMEGDTFTNQELLEVSFVNVPANPQAMIMAYKSLEAAGFEKDAIAELGIPVHLLEETQSLRSELEVLKAKFDGLTVVKAQPIAAPQGRSNRAVRESRAMTKVIARTADKLLETKSLGSDQARLVKVMKKASERLSLSQKEQLSGTNTRTT